MDRVKKIISKLFDIDEADINEEMTPDNVKGWDSLGQMALVSGIEEEFGIEISFEEIFRIMSVKDMYTILKEKGISNV